MTLHDDIVCAIESYFFLFSLPSLHTVLLPSRPNRVCNTLKLTRAQMLTTNSWGIYLGDYAFDPSVSHAAAIRRTSSGVRGGGTGGLLWPRVDGAVSVMARRALSALDAGARVLRHGLHKCAPYLSCFQVSPAGDYYFLQSASNRR